MRNTLPAHIVLLWSSCMWAPHALHALDCLAPLGQITLHLKVKDNKMLSTNPLCKLSVDSKAPQTQTEDWLVENLAVAKEDGSLKRVVEQYLA